MKKDTEEKLIRIDFTIKYSVVGLNVYNTEDLDKLAEEIFTANRNDIINESLEFGTKSFTEFKGTEIKTKEDLPDGYNPRCLPWLSVVSGSKDSETIGYYLGEKKKK
jgi:hypothetical protein